MHLDFEYGNGMLGGELPDTTDVFVTGETVKDPECLPQDWDSVYAATLESAEVSAGCTAVLELLDAEARLADVPLPESGGLLSKLGRTFAKTDGFDPPYRRLELK